MYNSGNGDADNTESEFARYDTRCYFNVRSKADISQLNLPQDRKMWDQMSGLEKTGPVFVGPNVGAGKCRTGNCGTGK